MWRNAIDAILSNPALSRLRSSSDPPPSLQRLTSVVGSPHYVAPEVLQEADNGYDGLKLIYGRVGLYYMPC